MIYARDFTRLVTNGGSCDPSLEVAKVRRAWPRRECAPSARRIQPRSSSSRECAPHPLTHPRRWRADTTLVSNYNPQLTYEFD